MLQEREQLLLIGTPGEVLARIVPKDSLGIRALAAERLRNRALFLDLERLCLCAYAVVARDACGWRGRPELGTWLVERVDRAIEDLLAEERDYLTTQAAPGLSAFRGSSTGSSPGSMRAPDAGTATPRLSPTFVQLARPLGLDPDALRSACARFHGLDRQVREAFFELVVEGRSLDHLAFSSGTPATTLARHARRALDVLRQTERFAHHPHPELHLQQPRATS